MFNVSREFYCCYNQNKIQCNEDEGYEMFEFTQWKKQKIQIPKNIWQNKLRVWT